MSLAIRRRSTLLCALAVAVLGSALPSSAAAQGDNSAVAVNTKDNSSIFRLAFNIRRVTGDVVDQTNAAVAYSSCEECRTVAIAIQILIVQSDPSVVTPQNLALAINESCSLCDTFAFAYQIVLGDGTRLRFTPEGNKSIAELRRDLKDLRKQDLSDDELAEQLGTLVNRLRGVLDTELVGVGQQAEHPTPAPQAAAPGDGTPTQTTPAATTTAPPAQQPTTPAQTTTTAPPAQTTTSPAPVNTTTAPAPTQTTP